MAACFLCRSSNITTSDVLVLSENSRWKIKAMAQQDQAQKCSSSGGGGKSSRKAKQKKVPQRGLGVAQLERIRVEEEKRKEAASSIFATPSPSPPSSSSSVSLATFHHHSNLNHLSASIPCGGSPLDDDAKAANSSTFEAATWHSIPVHGHGNIGGNGPPKLCDFEKEILSTMSLPNFESNPTWLFQDWTQRTQQQPCSSMVVNDYSITEPPSNQNYSSSNSCVPMKQEEKMMMGLKRSYPFSMDVPSASSSFNFKIPTFTTFMRTNEKDSCGSGTTGLNFDAASSTFREVLPFCSTLKNSEPNSKKSNKENENFNGDFLTLAPPPTPPSQGINLQDQIPPLHSFFPPPPSSSSTVEKCNGGNGESSIDLNLKL
ncbi:SPOROCYTELESS-like EAR-containing protein [Senna tora]|uniref:SPOROCYTELESS-like EAR-containing protein n=1 Tax=Senna tora TaxID=362788 RepID=A0A834X349_9FABA|nr:SPOROCYTELESS-like EAR-containing protein [Senna tora]